MINKIRAILIGKSYRLIRLGIGLSICFLIFDIIFDAYFFAEESMLDLILAPSPYEIYMRFSVVTIILLFSFYAQVITRRLQTNQSRLEQELTERKQAEIRLRESQEKIQKIFDSSPDAIYLIDLNGMIVECNQTTMNLHGYSTKEELLGTSGFNLVVERQRQHAMELLGELVSRGTMHNIELTMARKDGSQFEAETAGSILRDSFGEPSGLVIITTDIAARKQADKRIQRQFEHLTALSSIDRVVASNFDLKLSLSEILTHVTIELGVDAADILILNSSSQILEYGADRGFRARTIKKAEIRLGEDYAGRVALERQLVQVPNLKNNIPDDPFMTSLLTGEDFVCYYGVPLITKGQVKGVLEVFHRSALEPDGEWFDFLDSLAGQSAIALENSTLFESLQNSNVELSLAYDATIEGWSRALDLRDKETEGHTQRVTTMTVKLARAFGFNKAELVQVRWGALLHDIGKMGVPDGILFKPGPLTDEEWVVMKKHPTLAYEMLAPIRYLRLALDIPNSHHEKWDGTGYPHGLKGTQIPLVARIFAVVDVWDALSSDRPYRPAWTTEKVREYIRASSGTHFDPQVVDIFMLIPD